MFPSQIEKVIMTHTDIESCCAVAIQDKKYSQGNLPLLFAVRAQKSTKSDDSLKSELRYLCEKELPEYAQPCDFVFINSLPLTPIGKIDYRALEDMANKEDL